MNFFFKKKFGQNFISDVNLLKSIVLGAGIEKNDTALEIGCGGGSLTAQLCEKAGFVIGYEIDNSLNEILAENLKDYNNVKIIYGDFLKADVSALEKELTEYKVVANLPYYITTPIITKLINESEKLKSLTVTVQEEVAERLTAVSGTKEYGSITVFISAFCDVKIVKKVSRKMFYPVPNVDSAVIKIDINKNKYDIKDKALFQKILFAVFSGRRKTLVNNLISCFSLSRDVCGDIIKSLGLDINIRGEALSVSQFVELYKIILDK